MHKHTGLVARALDHNRGRHAVNCAKPRLITAYSAAMSGLVVGWLAFPPRQRVVDLWRAWPMADCLPLAAHRSTASRTPNGLA